MLLQLAGAPYPDIVAPTTWQLIVAIAGVSALFVIVLGVGVAYGRIMSRVESLERNALTDRSASAKASEVQIMFATLERELSNFGADTRRRLERIEQHFDKRGDKA